jgi:hypothetical protein
MDHQTVKQEGSWSAGDPNDLDGRMEEEVEDPDFCNLEHISNN